jgi:hypothetical protein
MRSARIAVLAFAATGVFLFGSSRAQATACGFDCTATIEKSNTGEVFTLPDGTSFYGIDPSDPSTGTGVFEPFVRGQRTGPGEDNLPEDSQTYYNTDGAIEFETKQGQTGGTNWTHSVEFSDIQFECDAGTCVTLVLDANEPTGSGSSYLDILLDDMKIYLLDAPDVTSYDIATGQLGGEDPVWTLDSLTNGDVTIDLYANICKQNGQCGSGHGDFAIEIPLSQFSNLDGQYFYWFNENSFAADGFEEWKVLAAAEPVPEPSAALTFGLGTVIAGAASRRARRR